MLQGGLALHGPDVRNPGGGIASGPPGERERAGGAAGFDACGWDLVVATQRGDREAFGELYDRYVGVVFRFVLLRVGECRLAEDLTSETFVRALRGIGSVRDQGRDVGAWLVTIARNLVLDHVKSSRYRLEVPTAEVVEASAGEPGPEQQLLRKATVAELMCCVALLRPAQRECVVLRFLEGLSVAQTAAAMGRTHGAVKAMQYRAVRRLGRLLAARRLDVTVEAVS